MGHRNLLSRNGVTTLVIVTAVLSLVLALSAGGVLFGTFQNLRQDRWSIRARDRFFARWFRWVWLVGGIASAYLLAMAAWLIWISPLLAIGYFLLVPVVAGSLVLGAKRILPWLYQRRLRR